MEETPFLDPIDFNERMLLEILKNAGSWVYRNDLLLKTKSKMGLGGGDRTSGIIPLLHRVLSSLQIKAFAKVDFKEGILVRASITPRGSERLTR